MSSTAWARALTGVALALVWSACWREPGTVPPDTGVPVNEGDLTHGHCINTCQPDYGSGPVNCAAAEHGFEFFPGRPPGGVETSAPVWDFEYTQMITSCDGSGDTRLGYVAHDLYSYTDKTSVN